MFYGKDAFEGLSTMDGIVTGAMDLLNRQIDERLSKRSNAEEVIAAIKAKRAAAQEGAQGGGVAVMEGPAGGGGGARGVSCCAVHARQGGGGAGGGGRSATPVLAEKDIPVAPFFGSRVVKDIALDQVFPFINTTALFRGQWQMKKGAMSEAEYEALVEDKVMPVFERLKKQCREEGILRPAVVYGYYPCNSEGDDLIVWDPAAPGKKELERFTFPRQADRQRLCISDFFVPRESGRLDVLAALRDDGAAGHGSLPRVVREERLHGVPVPARMGVETAERLAEMWHKRIRQEANCRRGLAASEGVVHAEVSRVAVQFRIPRLPGHVGPGETVPADRAGADRVRLDRELAD